jgi:chemotaxis protein CheD
MFIQPNSITPPLRPRITVMQGSVEVSGDEDVLLTTILGSCIAACLYDSRARIGGMNHFLLAEPMPSAAATQQFDEHYGLYLMELLINEMMKAGAAKSRMRAHLYGGANIQRGMRAIGSDNAAFAERFLNAEGISIGHSDVGGTVARRVDFLAAQGKSRCRHVTERVAPPPVLAPANKPGRTGDVEFF